MARFATIGEAQAACSALRAAGIDAQLADENLISIDWLYSQAVGSVKVLVAQEDLEQARGILWSAAAEPPLSDPESAPAAEKAAALPPHSETCPECSSSDIRPARRFLTFLLIGTVFLALGNISGYMSLAATAALGAALALLMSPSHRCGACGNRWNLQRQKVAAPPPDPADTIEEPCPRCGSLDVYRIDYRRLKAISMLFTSAILIVLPLFVILPKRRCDKCGLELR